MAAPGGGSKKVFSAFLKSKQPNTVGRNTSNISFSSRELDPVFQGAGQKDGLDTWKIENSSVVPVYSYGKFFTEDQYIILKTTVLRNGSFQHDIHYWLGKDTSKDAARTAVTKSIELVATLGAHAVQYREVQEYETARFLSYFKPCIIPHQGAGSSHSENSQKGHAIRLFVCKGKHSVHVKEVPFARASLNHDDIFILDTKAKIFQFSGSNSTIQERAKALEVVQYIRDTYHDGECEVAAVEDGRLMADADAGEFWALFGGFAPLPRKSSSDDVGKDAPLATKLLCFYKDQTTPVNATKLTRELLETNKCYFLDFGVDTYVWMGKESSLEARKWAGATTEELVGDPNRPKSNVTFVMEGFESVMFRSKFDKWPEKQDPIVSEEGKGKVAAFLRRQGLAPRSIAQDGSVKEEPKLYIDCTGHLQVWRVNDTGKDLVPPSEPYKFYTGDCYIFQYSYPGEDGDECLISTWFGKKSLEDERTSALLIASRMIEALRFQAAQARLYEGRESNEFFSIFQNLVVCKGGLSSGYQRFIIQYASEDDTYSEKGLALFRIQGLGPENMQAIQVDPVASSLNSSYCYILHDGDTVFTWIGSLTTSLEQDLLERQLDVIKPNSFPKILKEGAEVDLFWKLLGGKSEYPSQMLEKDPESDPHLFACTLLKGILEVTEIFNFTQDDFMAEDIFVLDCHAFIFVWFGKKVDAKSRAQTLIVGEKFLEIDILMENLSRDTPIYVVAEGSEPLFFTHFFSTWDPAKSAMHGSSFDRKLSILKNGVKALRKPKKRTSSSGRSNLPDQTERYRSMSTGVERRARGRSPAFKALAANFENPPSPRNLSLPPQPIMKLYARSTTPDPSKQLVRSGAIAKLTVAFEHPAAKIVPKMDQVKSTLIPKMEEGTSKPEMSTATSRAAMSAAIASMTIKEDDKEGELDSEERQLPVYPYERLKTSANNPPAGIDRAKREAYLSSLEFMEKFKMTKEEFYKMPKWKQDELKKKYKLF